MSRSELPFYSDDISAFARLLNRQIAESDHIPTHLELLNMLARSAGYRNYQHFRSQAKARVDIELTQPQASVDFIEIKRLSRFFDEKGKLLHWPGKASWRIPCLWVLWSRLPARQPMSEQQLNKQLMENHVFGDPALLRRELFDNRMVTRTADCREYRRIECRPSAEAAALIRYLESRRPA